MAVYCKMLPFLLWSLLLILPSHLTLALPATTEADAKLVVITEDVIPDTIEMDQKKVIRVNPLDLPPIKEDPNNATADSSLYKIQSIKPIQGKRKYMNSANMRKPRPQKPQQQQFSDNDSPIVQALPASKEEKFVKPKHQPKKKHLHFLYNQDDWQHNPVAKTMRVHTAPGAYPVFYVLARTNGGFGKYPLKSFSTPTQFMKYLHKKKIDKSSVL